ncbi:hypothetical protein [Gottfriedia acidiceleris]|uniref:hypothetical protein n=1 Tax=Gottfriedia acidiceleris TaxID=371036 RepID=UPI003D1F7503
MWKKFIGVFLKYMWPEIKELLLKYWKEISEFVLAKVTVLFKKWFDDLIQEKVDKSEESLKKSETATDPEEKKKYQYEAEFYKREAESLAEKIKDWEVKYEKLKQSVDKEVKEKTTHLKSNDLFESNSKGEYKEIKLVNNQNILRLENKNE